jgi:hypothetical protein
MQQQEPKPVKNDVAHAFHEKLVNLVKMFKDHALSVMDDAEAEAKKLAKEEWETHLGTLEHFLPGLVYILASQFWEKDKALLEEMVKDFLAGAMDGDKERMACAVAKFLELLLHFLAEQVMGKLTMLPDVTEVREMRERVEKDLPSIPEKVRKFVASMTEEQLYKVMRYLHCFSVALKDPAEVEEEIKRVAEPLLKAAEEAVAKLSIAESPVEKGKEKSD